jgi:hypothetical protein
MEEGNRELQGRDDRFGVGGEPELDPLSGLSVGCFSNDTFDFQHLICIERQTDREGKTMEICYWVTGVE